MKKLRSERKPVERGGGKILCAGIANRIRRGLYRVRAEVEDRWIGGISLEHGRSTRFPEMGAHATESTNYVWLDRMFQAVPLEAGDVFLDIGCGEGRVLTYLYLRGFRGPMTGVELDPEVAATAARRTEDCANIIIHQGNILRRPRLLADATAVYMFNPFTEEVLEGVADMVEHLIRHPVKVYYCNDLYAGVLDGRKNWTILHRDVLDVPSAPKSRYTVYRYQPEI